MLEPLLIIARLICYSLIAYVAVSTVYMLFLAISLLFTKPRRLPDPDRFHRFAVLVPAHNEEAVIGRLCESLLQIDYPAECFEVFVIADNCSDGTAKLCKGFKFQVLERTDTANQGKGYALKYGLEQIGTERFDAVLIVDADNVVVNNILTELNRFIDNGSLAVQCNNRVGNREGSWFTEVLFVTRTISGLFYHEPRYRFGSSSYLMGTGMCLSTDLLARTPWDAFSVGEDLEYYARLADQGVKVDFSREAEVFHLESTGLKQATSQRLRWSKGRFSTLKKAGLKLLVDGIRERDAGRIDSSMPLILPNYSLLVNLSLLALVLASALVFMEGTGLLAVTIVLGAITGQIAIFAAGAVICGRWRRTMMAAMMIPVFLVWKLVIDVLGMTGIYRGKRWVRTSRG